MLFTSRDATVADDDRITGLNWRSNAIKSKYRLSSKKYSGYYADPSFFGGDDKLSLPIGAVD